MAVTVAELAPGDRVTLGGMSATYVQQAPHPLWPHLRLVLWHMDDGSWSHDALAAAQEVGDLVPSGYESRMARLSAVFLGGR